MPEHPATGAAWYILRCGAGLEVRAEKTMRDSGWCVFLPRERKWRVFQWRRRAAEDDYPKFPGYLFLSTSPPAWPTLSAWPLSACVRGILGMAGVPVAVAAGEVETLMACDGRYVPPQDSAPLHKAFAAGDRARVTAGAWRDWVVRLDAVDAAGARISVPLLGHQAQAVLPLTWLEAA